MHQIRGRDLATESTWKIDQTTFKCCDTDYILWRVQQHIYNMVVQFDFIIIFFFYILSTSNNV